MKTELNLCDTISRLKGIGPKTLPLFHKLNLFNCGDVLFHVPTGYQTFSDPKNIDDLLCGEVESYLIKIPNTPITTKKVRNLTISSFCLSLEKNEKKLEIVFFNMPYLRSVLKPGKNIIVRGSIVVKGSNYSLEQPTIFTIESYEELLHSMQPIYSLTKGLTSNIIKKAVSQILTSITIEETLPSFLITKYQLISRKEAFYALHFPSSKKEVLEARKRLVFEEFLSFSLAIVTRKKESISIPFLPPLKECDIEYYINQLPYTLTNAQIDVWNEIKEDLKKDIAMNRLIQGDVGSGKTILAFFALLYAAKNNRQAALMAPTEVLAKQHFETLVEHNEKYKLDIAPILLVGSMTKKEKKIAYDSIKEGTANIIIGTHALIQEAVSYQNLSLVITDEQHRFGVRQRETLANKGFNVHLLVMSATPIPRTLSIVLFGDLFISTIQEMPIGRLPIKNCVVNRSFRKKAYEFITSELECGHQAYVICPMVEPGELDNVENVIEYSDTLKDVFPDSIKIAYLHGKMKPSLKNEIMEAFSKNEIQILVSTTVIEVGINVPNATVMMVENAERFGLATLHQLRGRVGRGEAQSYCIFVNGKDGPNTNKRLKLLETSNDGFYLANEDLKLRGPGDLFGIKQSGELNFSIGNIYDDSNVLLETNRLAHELIEGNYKGVDVSKLMIDLKTAYPNVVDFRTI
ncbi:MAG: ATP-dependent DNA helicase RecG [Lachnospiraceae bacterium]